MDAPPPGRRARKLLPVLVTAGVVIILLRVTLYPVYVEWSREREIIEFLDEKGLHCRTDPGLELWKTLGITLFDRVSAVTPTYGPGEMASDPLSDDDLLEIGRLRYLRFLAIESPITDASLPVLLGFEDLQQLIIHNTALSEGAVEKLRDAIPKVSLNRWGD